MRRHVLIFGLAGSLLISLLQYSQYRFVVIEHSVEIYAAIVAVLFASFGIWLGQRLTGNRVPVVTPIVAARAAGPFAADAACQQRLAITPRELEILGLVAQGLSNQEIATRLFVSENTVKTHCARVFDKLGAARRTQAVRRGQELGLLP